MADDVDQVDKSPYNYGWNNPISTFDPDGRKPWYFNVVTAKVEYFRSDLDISRNDRDNYIRLADASFDFSNLASEIGNPKPTSLHYFLEEGGKVLPEDFEDYIVNYSYKSMEEMDNAVSEYVYMQREKVLTNTRIGKFNTATVVYDKRTKRFYFGMNKGIFQDNAKIHQVLEEKFPEESRTGRRFGNCAECDAVNKALWNESNWNDLQLHTVGIDVRSGQIRLKKQCLDCIPTFKGLHITSE